MKKELIALGAALALVGTLTACSSTPADQNKGSAGQRRYRQYYRQRRRDCLSPVYPLRDERTASGHGYTYDGRYTAFPDGQSGTGPGQCGPGHGASGKRRG